MTCECCGCELDEECDELWECPNCGNIICEDCIVGEYGECINCLNKQKQNDIFKA